MFSDNEILNINDFTHYKLKLALMKMTIAVFCWGQEDAFCDLSSPPHYHSFLMLRSPP